MISKIISFIVSIIMFIGSLLGIGGTKIEDGEMIQYSADKKSVIIVLEENPSTGYRWTYKIANDGILGSAGDKYVAPVFSDAVGATGTPGTHIFTFDANKPGKTKLIFEYERSWEDAPIEKITVNVTVAEDMTVTAEIA